MAISPILSSNTANSSPGSNSNLNLSTFIQLLTTQLQSQDPLDPVSDTDFFAQLAQMGTVQGIDGMQQTMQMSQAASMLGKTVTALVPGSETGTGIGAMVTGVVNTLNVQNGQVYLQLGTANGPVQVQMGDVEQVSDGK